MTQYMSQEIIRVEPVRKNDEEDMNRGSRLAIEEYSYYLFWTKIIENMSKYGIPLCYMIFTITYVIIFFGELY